MDFGVILRSVEKGEGCRCRLVTISRSIRSSLSRNKLYGQFSTRHGNYDLRMKINEISKAHSDTLLLVHSNLKFRRAAADAG